MERLSDELASLFTSIWKLTALILLGIVGKFSYSYLTGKRITPVQAISTIGLAVFVGVIAGVLCRKMDFEEQAIWIVPIATLMSDKIIIAIMATDVKKMLHDWLKYWTNKLKS